MEDTVMHWIHTEGSYKATENDGKVGHREKIAIGRSLLTIQWYIDG